MTWIVSWSSWLEMIRSWRGPKNVSSSKRNGIAVDERAGYRHRIRCEPSTRSIRLLPRSAISR